MKLALFLYTFLYLIIIPGSGWASPPDELGCLSGQCHINMAEGTNLHPSGIACSTCHQQNNNAHPDNEIVNFSLKIDICINCHKKTTDYDYLHAPVAAGDCIACHSAHGKKTNNFIHVQKKIICYNCHEPVSSESDKVLHGEISEGKCTSCHTVHGSYFPKLLRANYSVSFFNNYKEEHYEFCFRCHKSDLLLHPNTSYNTNFREGKINLHYLHTNRKSKGQSCKSCHNTHASQQKHLMATSVYFGNWYMPINFYATENGGGCAPGCHSPKTYDRSLSKRKR